MFIFLYKDYRNVVFYIVVFYLTYVKDLNTTIDYVCLFDYVDIIQSLCTVYGVF